jgi:hypothetical protein
MDISVPVEHETYTFPQEGIVICISTLEDPMSGEPYTLVKEVGPKTR